MVGMAVDGVRSWDFFISYTQADRAWAEWIAWVLEEDSHRVLVQAWDFVPGTNWVQGMQAGTRDATRTIIVLSPDYLQSVYGGAEWRAAWASDPEGAVRKLLIVRVAESDRPGFLAGVVGLDLFGLTEAAAKARLRTMVAAALAGRAKPDVAPRYPGADRAMPRLSRFPGALPQVWKVPPRNPNFTGRGPELAEIAEALATGSTVTVHAVRGIGGVGKSQLAAQYAYAHAADYDVVWWIAAEEPAAIPDQFTELATRLGLGPAADPDILRDQVHDQLRRVPGWLLVFDNANRVDDVRPWLPRGPLPSGIPGHVIVTTRRGGFATLGRVLDLDVIDLPDAVQLLRTRVPNLDQQTGEYIAEELGRLPLALQQAAAYMDSTGLPAREYLELLRSRAVDLFPQQEVHEPAEFMASLRDLSLERIGAVNLAAVLLLDLCAYFAPEPIPLDLFTAHPDFLPEPLAAAARDPLAFNEAVSLIVDYSLALRTTDGLRFAGLVQASVRARHREPNLALRSSLALLRADLPSEVQKDPGGWRRWAVMLPHVLAVTNFSDALRPADGATRDARWLLERAGAYLQSRGYYAQARPPLERALASEEADHGADHPAVARRLTALAALLSAEGKPTQARPLLERATAIDEAVYGGHPVVASDLTNLAAVLMDLGRADLARPLQERALDIAEVAYGPDHPETARSLRNLADIARHLGEPALCRRLLTRALLIDESAYGPDHPVVIASLSGLADALHDLGEPRAALPLAERALAIAERAYGPVHSEVSKAMNSLALILQDLDRLDEAESLLRRSLDITEIVYGIDHPTVATALNNLALVIRQRGDLSAARQLLERALAISEAAEGTNHQIVLQRLRNLIRVLSDLGEVESARLLRERAASLTSSAVG